MHCATFPLLILSLAACSSSSSPSAALSLAVTPSPIHEAPCPPSHCGTLTGQEEAAGTVTLSETGGVAVSVTSVALSLQVNASRLLLASGQFDAAAVTALAGTDQVNARGTLSVPVGVHYDDSLAGSASTLTIVVNALDPQGESVTATTTVAVLP